MLTTLLAKTGLVLSWTLIARQSVIIILKTKPPALDGLQRRQLLKEHPD